MSLITVGELGVLWDAALSTIDVDEVSTEFEFQGNVLSAFGNVAWVFLTTPAAATFDLEYSKEGNVWTRIAAVDSSTQVSPDYGNLVVILESGKYRAVLRSKTGTTEVIQLTLAASFSMPSLV